METGHIDSQLFLFIDFPRFDYPVRFQDREIELAVPKYNGLIYDPEAGEENLVESKHRKLVRSHRYGPFDKDLKPNSKIRDEIYVTQYLIQKVYYAISTWKGTIF